MQIIQKIQVLRCFSAVLVVKAFSLEQLKCGSTG
jgi:hypothetical protein